MFQVVSSSQKKYEVQESVDIGIAELRSPKCIPLPGEKCDGNKISNSECDGGFLLWFHKYTNMKPFWCRFLIGTLPIAMVLMTRLSENFCRSSSIMTPS
ncbi:hypothetical protein AVEN_212684-1 [Araneus ventricosus]|uniref:Uncharacterized protein n=1 Tax=Araneus ventricosus TaxID=182803 RepID=A0A4Y2TJX6_ARAVE|nr:hypothetical protein AVEN_212684-1 [Araneus ventricosus]